MPKPYRYHFPPRIHVGYSTDGGDAATGSISSGLWVVKIIEDDEQIGPYALRHITPESPYTPTPTLGEEHEGSAGKLYRAKNKPD